MDWRKQARRALREYPEAKRRGEDTSAVDQALDMQSQYYNGTERLRMADVLYFRQTHTLDGASDVCHYSRETIKKWNAELLAAVYAGMKKETEE